ncbi:MAG: FAD:protein FMN transferase, partial [Chitinophagales bacterium]
IPSNLLSASIIAKDCATADAIATACMVMGYEKAKEFVEGQKDLKALLIYSNEKGEISHQLIGY